MYELADARLGAAGYDWYEVSNWARTPSASVAPQPRLLARQDWWGFGPGAHSHVGRAAVVERQASRRLRAAARGGRVARGGHERRPDAAARALERVLLRSRIREGLPVDRRCSASGRRASRGSSRTVSSTATSAVLRAGRRSPGRRTPAWPMPSCVPSPTERTTCRVSIDSPGVEPRSCGRARVPLAGVTVRASARIGTQTSECQQGGAHMVSERGLQVLRAIVQDYVDTHEPVGSNSIVERHAFGVSAATIRNDMALLEDEELIAAPHTSSGRVPTDKGYRVFVDHLAELRPLSPAQRTRHRRSSADPADLDDVLARTVRAADAADRPGRDRAVPVVRARACHARRARLARRRASARRSSSPTPAGSRSGSRSTTTTLDETDSRCCARVSAPSSPVAPCGDGARRVCSRSPTRTDPSTRRRRCPTSRACSSEELEEFRQDRLVMAGAANLARRETRLPRQHLPAARGDRGAGDPVRSMSEMVADEQRARGEYRPRERAVRASVRHPSSRATMTRPAAWRAWA